MWISLREITIQVGAERSFAGATWEIEKNENWAILGSTGSGKTTLARALCRKLPLVAGQILFYFDEVHEPHGRSYLKPKEIAVLSAETHQDFLRPYAEYHQARWQSFEGTEAPTVASLFAAHADGHSRHADLIRLLQLEPLLDRKILHLSHGESRKVLIARLWLDSPRLIILDDPYTGLDLESRAHLSQAIEALIRQGEPQLLFISSRPAEIPAGIQHVLWVKDNQVAAQGDRKTVLGRMAADPASSARSSGRPRFQKTGAFEASVARYAQALSQNPALRSADLIRMKDVSVRYGETQVLQGVCWTVRQAERWVLQGRNGAGKTTLLSLILGDNPQAYTNEIDLFGRRRGTGESIWEIKRNIGWVSPELQLYYPKTAACQNVVRSGFFDSAGLYRACSPEQEASAAGWMKAFGMESLAGLPFASLSAGQQRQALLARALVKNPPLLVLDEPCQGLDETHRRSFVELLDQLCARAPVTLIYVTHQAGEIPRAITHRLKLEYGEVVQIE